MYALFSILYQTFETYSFSRYLSIYHTRNYNTDLFIDPTRLDRSMIRPQSLKTIEIIKVFEFQ